MLVAPLIVVHVQLSVLDCHMYSMLPEPPVGAVVSTMAEGSNGCCRIDSTYFADVLKLLHVPPPPVVTVLVTVLVLSHVVQPERRTHRRYFVVTVMLLGS